MKKKVVRELLEMFDKPLKWVLVSEQGPLWDVRWETPNDEYQFMTQKEPIEYETIIKNYLDGQGIKLDPSTDVWSVAFATQSLGWIATGHQESLSIFSTVFDILKSWVIKYNPPIILLAAKTEEQSRMRLYDSFCRKVDDEFQYLYLGSSDKVTALQGLDESHRYYWLIRKDIYKNKTEE